MIRTPNQLEFSYIRETADIYGKEVSDLSALAMLAEQVAANDLGYRKDALPAHFTPRTSTLLLGHKFTRKTILSRVDANDMPVFHNRADVEPLLQRLQDLFSRIDPHTLRLHQEAVDRAARGERAPRAAQVSVSSRLDKPSVVDKAANER